VVLLSLMLVAAALQALEVYAQYLAVLLEVPVVLPAVQ